MYKLFTALFFFAIFFVLFLLPRNVLAQQVTQATVSYQCTDFIRCSTVPDNKNCQPFDNKVHDSNSWEHRAQIDLSSLTFPPSTDVYVTECLSIGEDLNGDGKAEPVCTTGDSTLDKTLFCGDPNDSRESCDHLSLLKDKGYGMDKNTYGIFHLINGKYERAQNLVIQTDANGKSLIPKVEWQSYSKKLIERRFQAWYKTPEPTPTPTNIPVTTSPGVSPAVGGQQQNILSFPVGDTSAEIPSPANCKGQAWDPYGFVFDMKSLEPIPDANILLNMKKPDGSFDAAYAVNENSLILNPFATAETGQFTFFVKDGDYTLTPSKGGYTQPKSDQKSLLLPNSTQVYSDAIYYSDSLPIHQQGSIQRRDIPLWPAGVGQTYPLKILAEVGELSPNGWMIYTGKVSHPYAEMIWKVCKKLNGEETCKEPTVYNYLNGGPNQFGNFSVSVDQKLLQSGEYYKRSFRKTDLTKIKLSKGSFIENVFNKLVTMIQPKAVYAMEPADEAIVNPILSYIEGFSYDATGTLLPNTEVQIIVPLSEVSVYKTQANAKGYYKITSEFLPKTEYAIKYIPLGSNTGDKITTSQFLSQNQEFIATEKINPYLVTTKATDPRKNIVPTYVPPQKIASIQKEFKDTPTNTSGVSPSVAPQSSSNNIFLIGAIILSLVAMVGVAIGVFLYQKKMKNQPPD